VIRFPVIIIKLFLEVMKNGYGGIGGFMVFIENNLIGFVVIV